MENEQNQTSIYYSKGNVRILNSYLIKDDNEKLKTILELKLKYRKELEKRTIEDLFYEWKAHNILYQKKLFKKSTKDTDFEFNQKKIIKLIYKIISKIFKEKT